MGELYTMKGLFEKLRYHFDRFLAKGTVALVISLLILMVVIVSGIGFILYLINPELHLGLLIWKSFMQTLDAGNLSGEEGSVFHMVMMTLATLVGIFITSLFISFILNGFQSRLEALSRGRSKVIESNHTLILGWRDNIFVVVKELLEANRSAKKPVIVILSNKDTVEMNRELKDAIENYYNTRIICRTGSIYKKNDLDMCNIENAKSVIILENDLNTIKALLVVSDTDFFKKEKGHISVLMDDPENISVAKKIGKEKLEVIYLKSAITRIIAQTCLQVGLSQVYNELLDFYGDEFYFFKDESLIGKTFRECIMLFPTSSVIGLLKDGQTIIRPAFDTVVSIDDEVIVIAEDDDKIEINNIPYHIDEAVINYKDHQASAQVEFISIIGYNSKMLEVLNELNNYLVKGSKIKILVNSEDYIEPIRQATAKNKNTEVDITVGETYSRPLLTDFLDVNCKRVIIFANENMDDNDKDSQTLLTLLHLRDIEEIRGDYLDIISEISDVKNSEIIDLAKSDDFIISELIASKLLSQISENRLLVHTFEELLSNEGSEIYVKPIEDYIHIGNEVDFYTVNYAAIEKNEIAIGYIINQGTHFPKVIVNPNKTEKIRFKSGDMVVVIAED